MPVSPATVSFQNLWKIEAETLAAVKISSNGNGIALLTKSGVLQVLNPDGNSRFTLTLGSEIRDISLAETGDVLATTDKGFMLLIDAQGQTLWKKRPVPALLARISASGERLVLVTREPTLVSCDRQGAIQWVYRNLHKTPTLLDISHNGETTIFDCRDERETGFTALSDDGSPHSPFMGFPPLQDLALDPSGQIVSLIDRRKGFSCISDLQRRETWKAPLFKDFHGVSYASGTRQFLLFSHEGSLLLLGEGGVEIWKDHLPHSLLQAKISDDGRRVFYASPEGLLGCLESLATRDLSRQEFVEITSPVETEAPLIPFRRVWEVDIETSRPEHHPLAISWIGDDRVEYVFLWDGMQNLQCLNDFGEEVWNNRVSEPITMLQVQPRADLLLALSPQALHGFTLDGSTKFRVFGSFDQAHVFHSGSFLARTSDGQIQFFPHGGSAPHLCPLPEPVAGLTGGPRQAFLLGSKGFFSVDHEGKIIAQTPLPTRPTLFQFCDRGNHLLVALNNGDYSLHFPEDSDPQRGNLLPSPTQVWADQSQDLLFALYPHELLIQNNQNNQRHKVSLSSQCRQMVPFSRGVAISNDIDEVLVIGPNGEIRSRQPIPDRIIALVPSRHTESLYVLREGGITCLTARIQTTPDQSEPPPSGTED